MMKSSELHYFYKIRDSADNIWTVNEDELATFSQDPTIEILRGYVTGSVRIDGVWYRRSMGNTIATTSFFTNKRDHSDLDDRLINWDGPYIQLHRCRVCDKDWEMAEPQFLKTGEINCNHCGANGSTGMGFW